MVRCVRDSLALHSDRSTPVSYAKQFSTKIEIAVKKHKIIVKFKSEKMGNEKIVSFSLFLQKKYIFILTFFFKNDFLCVSLFKIKKWNREKQWKWKTHNYWKMSFSFFLQKKNRWKTNIGEVPNGGHRLLLDHFILLTNNNFWDTQFKCW